MAATGKTRAQHRSDHSQGDLMAAGWQRLVVHPGQTTSRHIEYDPATARLELSPQCFVGSGLDAQPSDDDCDATVAEDATGGWVQIAHTTDEPLTFMARVVAAIRA